jgi:hypothetical protein
VRRQQGTDPAIGRAPRRSSSALAAAEATHSATRAGHNAPL